MATRAVDSACTGSADLYCINWDTAWLPDGSGVFDWPQLYDSVILNEQCEKQRSMT